MRVFADSFYFLALLNINDPAHPRAVRFAGEPKLELITTRWALAEVADALCAPGLRERVVRFIDNLVAQPDVSISGKSDELFKRGFDLYRERSDKHWSLTDCISFVVMEREGVREALTGDRHFEQAGFVALLAQ